MPKSFINCDSCALMKMYNVIKDFTIELECAVFDDSAQMDIKKFKRFKCSFYTSYEEFDAKIQSKN